MTSLKTGYVSDEGFESSSQDDSIQSEDLNENEIIELLEKEKGNLFTQVEQVIERVEP